MHLVKNKGMAWVDPRILEERLDKFRTRSKKMSTYRLKFLSDKQLWAIHLLSDFEHNYSVKQIAGIIGIDQSILKSWRRDPLFLRALDEAVTKQKNYVRREAFGHMFRLIKAGDYKAIRDYLKMTGDLTENIRAEIKDVSEKPENDLDSEIKQLSSELGVEIDLER